MDYDEEFNFLVCYYNDNVLRIINIITNSIEMEILEPDFRINLIKIDKTYNYLICGTNKGFLRYYLWPFYGF